MRINLYAEELTDEVELVSKEVTDAKFGTRTFYGVRIFLKSPPELHTDPEDDDRSAITFWVPWTRENGHDPKILWDLISAVSTTMVKLPYGHDPSSEPKVTVRQGADNPHHRDSDAGYR